MTGHPGGNVVPMPRARGQRALAAVRLRRPGALDRCLAEAAATPDHIAAIVDGLVGSGQAIRLPADRLRPPAYEQAIRCAVALEQDLDRVRAGIRDLADVALLTDNPAVCELARAMLRVLDDEGPPGAA